MKFTLNDYFEMHRKPDDSYSVVPGITCRDGFTISVQASKGHYCIPRNNEGPYTHVECGFPSEVAESIMEWCDNPSTPLDTVYGYVPVGVVEELILAHGGFSVKLPLQLNDGAPGASGYFSFRD